MGGNKASRRRLTNPSTWRRLRSPTAEDSQKEGARADSKRGQQKEEYRKSTAKNAEDPAMTVKKADEEASGIPKIITRSKEGGVKIIDDVPTELPQTRTHWGRIYSPDWARESIADERRTQSEDEKNEKL